MSGAYYNEIDPYAAQWLRNLIAAGHIAPGDVDERSIADVRPVELAGYAQCHFFAGIGVWSYALRLAGWPDDRPVWTGSCPCQPFSAAGKGEGTADARHLWPEWFRLIRECRPVAVFGEQVAAAIRHDWLDLVSADLEGAGYAVGSAVLGAHSVGAPHIRQRLYFMADAVRSGTEHAPRQGVGAETAADGENGRVSRERLRSRIEGAACELAHADGRDASAEGLQRGGEHGQQPQDGGAGVALGDTNGEQHSGAATRSKSTGGELPPVPGPVNGWWANSDWLPCIDGKARPVEPGTFPLVAGASPSMGFVCSACLETSEEGQNNEGVPTVRQFTSAPQGGVAQEVLQQEVHGGSVHQVSDQQGSGTLPGAAPVRRKAMRGLREDGAIPAPAPQGREPDEQHAGEHQDSVRELPREGTREDACCLCGAEADWLAEVNLRGNRVGGLRAYGNAINAEAAAAFIRAAR